MTDTNINTNINTTLFKTKPFEHQIKTLQESWYKHNWALFMEMGTGKSKVTIDTAVQLYSAGLIDAVLIFAPKSVDRVWLEEQLPSHFPDQVPMIASHWSSTANKELKNQWKKFNGFNGLKIMIVNIEAISYDNGHKFASAYVRAYGPRMLMVIDESTMIKGHTSMRTKRLIKLGEKVPYKRILTGQVAPQSPTDVYSQCAFLNPNLLGYSSYFAFRARYCTLVQQRGHGGRTFSVINGFKKLDELHGLLSKFSTRIKKEDCLDLPPKVYQTWHVELTQEQQKHYNMMKEEAIAIVEQNLSSAPMAITQLIRLQQILCGFITADDGRVHAIDNKRLDAVTDIIELSDDKTKFVIWASFRQCINDIAVKLIEEYGKESVVTFFGDTTSDERMDAINRFQKGTARFFVGNPASGRFGLTLTASSTVIYYNNNYNFEYRNQSEDRVHRIGQSANVVNYIDIVVPNSIDVRILNILKKKEANAAAVNGETLLHWLKDE